MTVPRMTPEVVAAVERKLHEQALRVLRGEPLWTEEEIREAFEATTSRPPLDLGSSRRPSEDR
jgi:hypothetical protein